MAAFEQGKDAILGKWSRIWDGKETLMACSGCPGGGGNRYAVPPIGAGAAQNPTGLQPREGYAVLRYKGQSAGKRVYRGGVTGTNYRFGDDPAHRLKYVFLTDLDGLLALRDGGQDLFERVMPTAQQVSGEAPRLEAPGPPLRSDEVISTHTPAADNGAHELSTRDLRKQAPGWSIEKAAEYLARERAQAQPRSTAVAILEDRIRKGG